MCGRYSLSKNKEELQDRFGAEMMSEFKPRFNIAPTQLVPVITSQSPKGFSFFYWGITPDFGEKTDLSPKKLINAKSETISEKASFKSSYQKRRCIIPADGFYEWKRLGKKTKIPYRFTLRDDALFSFAGIWEEFESTEGETQHTFMILTTSPNQSVKEIHDQMPVMLTRETEKIWLNNYSSHEELSPILAPFSADAMLSYTVSPLVNSPANDSSALIRRTSPMDQHGNYTLFG